MSTSAERPRFEVRIRAAAVAARSELERSGIPPDRLFACQPEGRDGTRLAGCVKTRVPWPDGQWGLVFAGDRDRATRKPVLVVVAFGLRHPDAPWRPSVYQVADRRLNR